MTQQSQYSYEELLACARGELFGAGNARLPSPPMLMFDRITSITKNGGNFDKGHICAELDLRKDLWFFQCHFVADPVMPGCLGLDALWQLVGFFLVWNGGRGKGRALGAKDVKFSGEVLTLNKSVRYIIHIKRVITHRLNMAVADGEVYVDDKPIYKAQDLRVGLFIDNATIAKD